MEIFVNRFRLLGNNSSSSVLIHDEYLLRKVYFLVFYLYIEKRRLLSTTD